MQDLGHGVLPGRLTSRKGVSPYFVSVGLCLGASESDWTYLNANTRPVRAFVEDGDGRLASAGGAGR